MREREEVPPGTHTQRKRNRKEGDFLKGLRWLDDHFEECILFTIVWAIALISFIQIIMRYALGSSLSWPEELNRYLFVWFAYISLSYAVRYSCHTRIDIFETLKPALKKPLSVVCDLGLVFFCLYLMRPGYTVVTQLLASGQTSSAMNLPMWIVYLSLFLGLILTLLRILEKYIKLALNRKSASGEEGRP